MTGAVREAALNLCALAIVMTVIPLVMIQIPGAVAWVVPPRIAAAGPAAVASLLRASGLALPAMAVAGSLAALTVRWLRAGPVLLAGLLILAAADALGGLTRTVVLIGADRALHGAGAGIAMAGVVAVVAERRPRRRPQPQEPNGGRRALAGCWGCLHGRGPGHGPGALLTRHPHARAVTATGLSVTAVGLAALDLAGSAAASGHLLALLCLPVAGGLAAALRTSGATGALAGVSGEIAGATPVLGAGVIPDHG